MGKLLYDVYIHGDDINIGSAEDDSVEFDVTLMDNVTGLEADAYLAAIADRKRHSQPPCIDDSANIFQFAISTLGSVLLKYIWHPTSLPNGLWQHLRRGPGWSVVASSDGTVVALLEESGVVIRTSEDDFAESHCIGFADYLPEGHVKGCSVLFGEYLHGCWNRSASCLAIAASIPRTCPGADGKTARSGILVAGRDGSVRAVYASPPGGVAGVAYCSLPNRGEGILALGFDRNLYFYCGESPAGKYTKGEVVLSLRSRLKEVSCMAFHPSSGSLAVGSSGFSQSGQAGADRRAVDDVALDLDEGSCYDVESGVTVSIWRVAKNGDHCFVHETTVPEGQGGRQTDTTSVPTKMSFAPSGRALAVVSSKGHLTLWAGRALPGARGGGDDSESGDDGIPGWAVDAGCATRDAAALQCVCAWDKLPVDLGSMRERRIADASWWSESALVVGSESGQVIVGQLPSLYNLLGEDPQSFASWPSLTSSVGGPAERVFVLECERSLYRVSKKTSFLADESPSPSLLWRILRMCAHHLGTLSMDDGTRCESVFRLASMFRTTPEAMFASLMERQEYGEALALLREYGLPTDPLYQQQWRNSEVFKWSINDFLSKVEDKEWVLEQIRTRVASTADGARALYTYGMKITAPSALRDWHNAWHAWYQGDKRSVASDGSDKESEGPPDPPVLTAEMASSLLHFAEFYSYFYRLHTFIEILQGSYDAAEFETFMRASIEESAYRYARRGEVRALEVLLMRHPTELCPAIADVLRKLPEVINPSNYYNLLPGVEGDSEAEFSYNAWHFEHDWFKHPRLRMFLLPSNVRFASDATIREILENLSIMYPRCGPYDEDGDVAPDALEGCESTRIEDGSVFCGGQTVCSSSKTADEISEWFRVRAMEIDSRCGMLENSSKLLECGMAKGVPSLESLLENIRRLELLVYSTCPTLSLASFLTKTPEERFRLALKECTPETVVSTYWTRGLPFLTEFEETTDVAPSEHGLLYRFLVSSVRADAPDVCDALSVCCAIFEASKPTLPDSERVISSDDELVACALDCVFACRATTPETFSIMKDILECLPVRDDDRVSTDEPYRKLHDDVDNFSDLLYLEEVAVSYGVSLPISELRGAVSTPSGALRMVRGLLEAVVKAGVSAREWRSLRESFESLHKGALQHAAPQELHSLFLKMLLLQGVFDLAREYVSNTVIPSCGARLAEEVVVEAAKHLFNAAQSVSDRSLSQAEVCFSVLPAGTQQRATEAEHLLCRGVRKLAKLYGPGGSALLPPPLEIRLAADRRHTYILNAFESNPSLRENLHSLMEVCDFLCVESSYKGVVVAEAGRRALEARDLRHAEDACDVLISERLGSNAAWLCKQLALHPDYEPEDAAKRIELLSFYLAHCAPAELDGLLSVHRTLLLDSLNARPIGEISILAEDADALSPPDPLAGSTPSVSNDEIISGDSTIHQPPRRTHQSVLSRCTAFYPKAFAVLHRYARKPVVSAATGAADSGDVPASGKAMGDEGQSAEKKPEGGGEPKDEGGDEERDRAGDDLGSNGTEENNGEDSGDEAALLAGLLGLMRDKRVLEAAEVFLCACGVPSQLHTMKTTYDALGPLAGTLVAAGHEDPCLAPFLSKPAGK